MNSLNKTLPYLQSRFAGKCVLVLGAQNMFRGTSALGLAIAFDKADVEKIEKLQQQVAQIGSLVASFAMPLEHVWLQQRIPEGLSGHQLEDAILPFWTPELFVSGKGPLVAFKEEGDDDSAGNVTSSLSFKALQALLTSADFSSTGVVQDSATQVFAYSDYAPDASATLLAELNKGFFVREGT